jgi:hypothetical protein
MDIPERRASYIHQWKVIISLILLKFRPFVLRFFQDPVKNLETTGIIQERVELMEKRMKKDIIEEMKEYGGRILLHEEEVSSSGFQVVVSLYEFVLHISLFGRVALQKTF